MIRSFVLSFAALVSLSACGPGGEAVVAACKAAIEAENDLPCANPAAFKNAEAECGDLADRGRIASRSDVRPGPVEQCAADFTCGDDKLVAYFECREESAFCDEQDQPAVADSCDDHLPGGTAFVVVR